MNAEVQSSRIQSDAGRLEALATVALIVVIVGVSVRFILLPVAHGLGTRPFELPVFLNVVGLALIEALPAILFAQGLSATQGLARRLRRGEMFTAAVGKGVSGIGVALLSGAVAMAVVTPWLTAVVQREWAKLGVEASTEIWVIAVVGLAMMLLGRLLGRAAAMQEELESYV